MIIRTSAFANAGLQADRQSPDSFDDTKWPATSRPCGFFRAARINVPRVRTSLGNVYIAPPFHLGPATGRRGCGASDQPVAIVSRDQQNVAATTEQNDDADDHQHDTISPHRHQQMHEGSRSTLRALLRAEGVRDISPGGPCAAAANSSQISPSRCSRPGTAQAPRSPRRPLPPSPARSGTRARPRRQRESAAHRQRQDRRSAP
jgi:hypothetical protein